MKMQIRNSVPVSTWVLVVLAMFMASCSQKLVPFTQEMREKYKLNEQDLKSIQFYTSREFVMKRGDEEGTKKTENGELTLTSERSVEEIIVKAETPCLVNSVVDGKRITIQFEDGANKYLVFGSVRNTDGYYTLQAVRWDQGKGKINYGDKYYYSNKGSRDVFLALKMKSIKKFTVDQKVVKGKKL